jgi:putrescine transport system ATP-binding protein
MPPSIGPADDAAFLTVRGLAKAFTGERVLEGLDIDLARSQTLAILGRSGCGKTTLLKILAGLCAPDAGSVRLGGRSLDDLAPQGRGVVYLYQEPLLFPHLDVFENVAFGLRLRRTAAVELRARVGEMLAALELEAHARKRPTELSGGQRQRVSFGRALIINPTLLLLDEPFGNLDVEIRAQMQGLFQQIARRFAITSLFVTHDLKEALLMGDRLALLRAGRLTAYPSREAFVADAETGAAREREFWLSLAPGTARTASGLHSGAD